MKGKKHSADQIIRKLREVERLQGEGKTLGEAARDVQVSEQTIHRWRAKYSGMTKDQLVTLKELVAENAQLKRIVADQVITIDGLRIVAEGKW